MPYLNMSVPLSRERLEVDTMRIRHPRLRTFFQQKSFLVQNVLTPKEMQAANIVVKTLTMNKMNSKDGLRMSFDKPLGSTRYMSNFERPAVLRQYFGLKAGPELVYAYGSGSGAKTVGTHPDYDCTREMTEEMAILAKCIEKRLHYLKKHCHLMPNLTFSLNHCTVLFYFHKKKGASNKMLAFHTDNVYSVNGKFLHGKNSQKENTPTCVVTIGGSRFLQFERQVTSVNPKTGRRKWMRSFVKSIELHDNSLFVLDPSDECPEKFLLNTLFRWRHGVPSFRKKQRVSVALVFRSVTDVTLLDSMSNRPGPSDFQNEPTMKSIAEAHRTLQELFIGWNDHPCT